MRKFIALFLIVCLLATCTFTGNVYALDNDVDMDMGMDDGTVVLIDKTYTIPQMAGKYKTQGRTTVINDVLMTDYTASGMEFKAHCSGDVLGTFNVGAYKKTYD